MTSIGRFSMKSENPSNLSNVTFFLALAGSKSESNAPEGGMTVPEFESTWLRQAMHTRHPRFHSRVSRDDDRFFEMETVDGDPKAEVHRHAAETMRPIGYRNDLRGRIEHLLTEKFDVMNKLWEVHISNGELGSSGAISRLKVDNIRREEMAAANGGSTAGSTETETILLFRAHHALADGVSLIAALADLSDEAEEFRSMVKEEMKRRKAKGKDVSLLRKLATYLRRLIWFCLGSIRALTYQGYLLLSTPRNPFECVLRVRSDEAAAAFPGRSVSWCDAAPLDEVKAIARAAGKGVTLNDVFVSCVTYAVAKQLAEHRGRMDLLDESLEEMGGEGAGFRSVSVSASSKPVGKINVVLPVHLYGGANPPGSSVGNRIGALVARCPGEMMTGSDSTTATDRLGQVHASLASVKGSPIVLLSWLAAKLCSDYLPDSATKSLFRNANANAAAVVSNSRGSASKMHINGRTVESAAGFLPLPPGVPVGVVVQSYAGVVSLSLTAERWAVPDGDRFMGWILEEYRRLCAEARAKEWEGA